MNVKKYDNYYTKYDMTDAQRAALISIADEIDEKTKTQIVKDYNNVEFMMACKELRETSGSQKNARHTALRQLYAYPSKATYNWLKSMFEPLYGVNWQKHPKVWNNEMCKVWRVTN